MILAPIPGSLLTPADALAVPLSEVDKRALVAFLKTLTDPRWENGGLAISHK